MRSCTIGTVPRPERPAVASDGVVARSYVANLRKGRIENPSYEKMPTIARAIARAMECSLNPLAAWRRKVSRRRRRPLSRTRAVAIRNSNRRLALVRSPRGRRGRPVGQGCGRERHVQDQRHGDAQQRLPLALHCRLPPRSLMTELATRTVSGTEEGPCWAFFGNTGPYATRPERAPPDACRGKELRPFLLRQWCASSSKI
jgi:hypothetical protein